MRRYTPYNYAFDNPLRYIDPDGMAAEDWIKYKDQDGTSTVQWVDDATDQESAQTWAKNNGKTDAQYIPPRLVFRLRKFKISPPRLVFRLRKFKIFSFFSPPPVS